MATSSRQQTPPALGEKHSQIIATRFKHSQQHRKGFLGALDRHQIDGTFTIILTILATYTLFPNSFAKKFLFFQKYDSITNTYEKTWEDIYFLLFWVISFTFLRATVMTYVLLPLACRLGVTSESVGRFAEKGWIFIYYMFCLQLTPTWNNYIVWFHTDQFFDSYPLTALPVITKYYYYLQFSFWIQQMFVLCIEAPRKDFVAMISHHLVTVMLITFSVPLNVTTFGTAIFVSMDLADVALSMGKCLKYIELPDINCETVFAAFIFIWIYTRHFLYGHIIYACVLYAGDYYSKLTHNVVVLLLLVLQPLMFFLLFSIFRIVYKMFANKTGVVDDRSDDEEPAVSKQENKQKIV
ncbi:sphingosine N-acyltransferase lag1 [Mortierella sp. AM989]|nr:sphingosine N-acyltransferase lag1 [Mortierella sp. AM989]